MVAKRLKTVWSHYLYQKYSAEGNGKLPPATAPAPPAPGKKFMIIRIEVNTPQPGIFMGFDSFGRSLNVDPGGASPSDEVPPARSEGKRRWSLLGKVLSLTSGTVGSSSAAASASGKGTAWDDQLEQARKEIASSRGKTLTGPPLPPKPSSGTMSSSSDASSTGSNPTFEAQQYVFKFILSFVQNMQPRDRNLTRPRLPAPAQAWVSARARSGSPPPPAAGLPAPTRRYSGLPQLGLVNEARNAEPLTGTEAAPRPSMSRSPGGRDAEGTTSKTSPTGSAESSRAGTMTPTTPTTTEEREWVPSGESLTLPAKPTGIHAGNAIYAGRALAEWSVVVSECNNFIERRRDEGILGLSEVEVPQLGVEGLRKIG